MSRISSAMERVMTGAQPYGRLQYKTINGKRMAYIDEGHGEAIVFQHGNPTSSYLWRNVMPHLEGLGRLVACDLIGMGGSDKLDRSGAGRYHYHEHRDYLFALWDALDLGDRVTFVLHDWGSALGFDWANRHRDRVAGLAYMEAIALPMDWAHFPEPQAQLLQGLRSPRGEAMVLDEDSPHEIGKAVASFVRAITSDHDQVLGTRGHGR
jgi:haloalkane dehalogenase